MSLMLVIDVLLAASLLVLAASALRVRNLFTAVVTFVIFGLLMSLAWVRLLAPDLALAEAAIGSGITGALFLGALRRLERRAPELVTRAPSETRVQRLVFVGSGVLLACTLCLLVPPLLDRPEGLASSVAEVLAETGVENPVTAVVLNLRAYDTLLELAVLLLAWAGASVLQGELGRLALPPATGERVVLAALVRFITPAVIMVAGYLVWVGAIGPGGAFQAGALLGGVGAIGLMAGTLARPLYCGPAVRPSLIAGAAVFLIVGAGTAWSGAFLEYRGPEAKALILVIEFAATASIGLVLTLLFAACTFQPDEGTGPATLEGPP
jgi:multisubunit Na+/H+ antiporter MnhB subunit